LFYEEKKVLYCKYIIRVVVYLNLKFRLEKVYLLHVWLKDILLLYLDFLFVFGIYIYS